MAVSAPRDDNRIPSLVGASSSDASVPVVVYADPTTHRLLVDSSGGSGSSATQVVVTAGTVVVSAGTMNVKIEDTAGNSITSTSNALDVNLKSSSIVQPVSIAGGTVGIIGGTVSIGSPLPAGTNLLGSVVNAGGTISIVGATVTVATALPTGTNEIGQVKVNAGTINAVIIGGTVGIVGGTVSVSGGTVNVALIAPGSNTIGTMSVIGNVANDAVDSGNPIKTGGQARTTNPTAVADADRVNFIADKLGKQIVVGAIRDLKATQTTSISNSTGTTLVVTAGAAGVFNDIYGVIASNTASAVNKVSFFSGSPWVAQFVLEVPANDMRGWTVPVDSAWPQPNSGTLWTARCLAAGSMEIAVMYVKNT